MTERIRGNPWATLLVLCLGFFMVLLDLTIVNIAIPSIIDRLKAGLDQVLWVLNAYTLTYAVLLIPAGRLGDRFGQRNLFAIGLALFTVASAACGLAQDPNQLIVARVVQGVGGALLTPQTLAIITTIFPAERRGAAFGVWGAIAGVATVTGPVLGGVLVTWGVGGLLPSGDDWRWIFYVNVPVGVLALLLTFLAVPDLRPGRRAGLEPVGVLLASAGLFLIVFGLIEGQRYDWGAIATWHRLSLTIPEVIGAGVVVLALFLAWDHFRPTPLVPAELFRDRNFAIMNWVGATLTFSMLGLFLPLVIYLQSALGFSAIKAGLILVPMSALSMVVAPAAGRLSDRIGGKYIVMAGMLLFAAGMALIDLRAWSDSDWLTFLPGMLIAGVGNGCCWAPISTVAMRNVAPRLAGAASGIMNTVRQVGGAVGSAVVGAVLANRLATTLQEQAVQQVAQLPAPARAPFVKAFSGAAHGRLELGRQSSSAGGGALSSLPPAVAQQLARAAHEVFLYGFIYAMRPTLLVPILALVLGAVSTLAVRQRKRGGGERVEAGEVEEAAAPAA